MGWTTTVMLAMPHADYTEGRPIEAGLRDLGFERVGTDRLLWLIEDCKLGHLGGVDGLRDLVLALPWHRWSVPTQLRVLVHDDNVTMDDDFSGRKAPFAWHVEDDWTIPAA